MKFAMISTHTYFLPIWISLFLQSVTWPLSDSLPEKVAHLSPWDWDDDDWFRRRTTRSPYIWNKYTFSPPDKYDKPTTRSNGPEPYVWVILGAVVIISLLILFIRYVCANSEDDTYDSRPVLHPPPAVIVPPPERTYQPTVAPPPPQHSRNTTTVPPGGGLYRAPTVPPTYGAGDRPPGYSEVVMADFVEEMKFPEVARRPLDTPPPKYEDGNLPKY